MSIRVEAVNRLRAFAFFPTRHRIRVVLSSLRERLTGLDFTLPDRMYDRGRGDGAMYLASSDSMLAQLFSCVDREKFHRFLDVGCGKGYVLWQAAMHGFSVVSGIEYDEKLFAICLRNLRRLGLADRIHPVCADACSFDGYGQYDVFYFFNPFGAEVLQKVMEEIIAQCAGREVMLLYYRPRYGSVIEACGCFESVSEFFDPERGYNAKVYCGKIPEKQEKQD